MFEFIGMAVIAWIVWLVGKAILVGSIKHTMLRACDYAENIGIPREFSNAMVGRPEILKQARRALANGNRDFAEMDAFEQYGQVIASLYSAEKKSFVAIVDATEKLQKFLKNQIDTLDQENSVVAIDDITIYYIFHLITMITKKSVSMVEVGNIMKNVFTDESSVNKIDRTLIMLGLNETRQRHGLGEEFAESKVDFENRKQVARGRAELKLAALLPIVKKEYEAGFGEFLIRHTRKAKEALELMFTESFDPTKIPAWTAKDLD
jgi:hypothetical protein